jgi:ABC-type proline/glycine betaine transport system permease subunit
MIETSTRSGRRGRGVRRVGALTAAAGLLLTGVLMGGPAVAAAAAEPQPVAVVQEAAPISEEAIIPIAETVETAPPLALSAFVISAVTVGAGGIVTARVLASRKRQPAVVRSQG